MSAAQSYSKQDPDYEAVNDGPSFCTSRHEEQSRRDKTVLHIKRIIERQFDDELNSKEDEVMFVDGKISQAKVMLDKLRSYLLANYFGYDSKIIKGLERPRKRKRVRDCLSSSGRLVDDNWSRESENLCSNNYPTSLHEDLDHKSCSVVVKTEKGPKDGVIDDTYVSRNRFYATRKVIVGNVSKFIPLDKREKNDQSTHKWMVYVRAPPQDPNLSSFVKRVWFFLHPSYMPNDIIEIATPPFTVTRRGWGEFPVRIQLIFCDPKNKPVDIIHNLKLDKTYTGLQTLGAETTVELEIQRHTFTPIEVNNFEKSRHSFLNLKDQSKSKLVYGETEDSSIFQNVPVQTENSNDKIWHLQENVFTRQSTQELLENSPCATNICNFEKLNSPANSVYSNEGSNITLSAARDVTEHSWLDEATKRVLVRQISSFPLICREKDFTQEPYCAKSLEQFKGWPYSKRRAAEWQRALDLKRAVCQSNSTTEVSTKQIMIWCRKHGHTPSEINTSVVDLDLLDFCPCCGRSFVLSKKSNANSESVVNMWCSKCQSRMYYNQLNSTSSFESFVAEISIQEYKLGLLKPYPHGDLEVNKEVDVVSCYESKKLDSSKIQTSFICNNDPLTIWTPEMDWVFDVAAQIQIHFPAVSYKNTKIPFTQHILLAVVKSFAREIVTNSYCIAKEHSSSNQPIVVTTMHIHQFLKETSSFDFLTNFCLGIQEDDGDP